jgi:hypothetical protein
MGNKPHDDGIDGPEDHQSEVDLACGLGLHTPL